MTDATGQARIDLAAAFRWAVREGFHEGICNHFSYALRGDETLFLINAHGLHWSEIQASNLLLVNGEGRVVEGEGEVEPTALYIHWRVHLQAPHARCVLHTHMPYATALSSLQDRQLRFINQNALKFYDRIAYDDDYDGLALDTAEGDRLAAVLGDKDVLLMGNHGVLVAGRSIAGAWNDLYYFERACRTYMLALSTGQAIDELPTQLVAGTAARIADEQDFGTPHFAALKRVLDREEPDYRR